MASVRIPAFAAATLTLGLGAFVAGSALAQPPANPPPLRPQPNPNYVAIVMEQDAARPAAEVWKRVGNIATSASGRRASSAS